MLLSLSNKAAFWTLIDTKGVMLLHLTFKDPGPKEIDYDKFSKKHQKMIDRAVTEGVLTQGEVE